MGIFGWSMPAGCHGTPYDDAQALDIGKGIDLPEGVLGLFWDEDDNLIESVAVTHPADKYAGTPEYTDCENVYRGVHRWSDDLSEEENIKCAQRTYRAIVFLQGATNETRNA